mgnify:CR=1 FL=1
MVGQYLSHSFAEYGHGKTGICLLGLVLRRFGWERVGCGKSIGLLKDNNNCILIASYGVMSTGITLSNLCYGVLFESFKSDVINMQSLGRGLGLSEMKDKYIVFDVIDCFNKNYLFYKSTRVLYNIYMKKSSPKGEKICKVLEKYDLIG